MFSYYGSKTNLAPLYPPPKFDKIIEPFAGSARYSLLYWERDILLVDKYPELAAIWKWLQLCSPKDILGLPRVVEQGEGLHSFTFDCDEARNFFGFIIGAADARPRQKITRRKAFDRPNFVNYGLQRVASNLFKIKHWVIEEGDYKDIPNQEATWFIDPPYQEGGHVYVKSNRHLNYQELSQYSQDRLGQSIVCENTKADWLPFMPIIKQRGSNATTTEAFWTNLPTSYSSTQSILF